MVHDSVFESRGAFDHSRSAVQHASQNHQRNPLRFFTSRGAHKRKPPARVCNTISLILQHARNVAQLFMHMAFMQLFLHTSTTQRHKLSPSFERWCSRLVQHCSISVVHDSVFESRGAFDHSRSALQHASQNHQRNPLRFLTSRGAHKRKPPARVCNKISLILQHTSNVAQLFMHMAFMQLLLHTSTTQRHKLSPSFERWCSRLVQQHQCGA